MCRLDLHVQIEPRNETAGMSFKMKLKILPASAPLNCSCTFKSLRGLYGMTRSILKNAISTKSMFTLFDALVKPIFFYACQIWGPLSNWYKYLEFIDNHSRVCLQHIAKAPVENFHLKFLKWYLGTHSKTCNVAVWGDTGRLPIVIEIAKLATDYHDRIASLNDDLIVKKAFMEQKTHQMPWYTACQKIIQKFEAGNYKRTSINVYQHIKNKFIEKWHVEKSNLPKLDFYNTLKRSFNQEKYLDINEHSQKRSLIKLRASSHRLNVEIGRYAKPPTNREDRICKHCETNHNIRVVDDEVHVIENCPLYETERRSTIQRLSNIIGPHETAAILVTGLAKIYKSSDDLRICRLQAKFIKNVFEKHKVLEDKRKPIQKKKKNK